MTDRKRSRQRTPISLSVRLSQEIYDVLCAEAEQQDRSLASMTRVILAERLHVQSGEAT